MCFRCDTPNPNGGGGGYGAWQGLDGIEGFEAGLEADEEAFRAAFGPAHSSGIDFSAYKDIPVEVELPRSMARSRAPQVAHPRTHTSTMAQPAATIATCGTK